MLRSTGTQETLYVAQTRESFIRRHDFLIRRIHSLLGVIPVGVFLVFHLTANMLVVSNTPENDYFQQAVDRIRGLGPFLIPTEIIFIFIPLLLHGGLGVAIWLEGKPNTAAYRYWGNARYMLQRTTGVVAMVFILMHVWHMHWVGEPFGGSNFDADHATATAAWAMQNPWWWAPVYIVGMLASVFHFANGMWAFMITWGITIGRKSQRSMGYVWGFVGVMIALAGLASVVGLMRYDNPQPKNAFEKASHTVNTHHEEVSSLSD